MQWTARICYIIIIARKFRGKVFYGLNIHIAKPVGVACCNFNFHGTRVALKHSKTHECFFPEIFSLHDIMWINYHWHCTHNTSDAYLEVFYISPNLLSTSNFVAIHLSKTWIEYDKNHIVYIMCIICGIHTYTTCNLGKLIVFILYANKICMGCHLCKNSLLAGI